MFYHIRTILLLWYSNKFVIAWNHIRSWCNSNTVALQTLQYTISKQILKNTLTNTFIYKYHVLNTSANTEWRLDIPKFIRWWCGHFCSLSENYIKKQYWCWLDEHIVQVHAYFSFLVYNYQGWWHDGWYYLCIILLASSDKMMVLNHMHATMIKNYDCVCGAGFGLSTSTWSNMN